MESIKWRFVHITNFGGNSFKYRHSLLSCLSKVVGLVELSYFVLDICLFNK